MDFWSADYAAIAVAFTPELRETWRTVVGREIIHRQQVVANDIALLPAGPVLVGSTGLTTDDNPWTSSLAQVLLVQLSNDSALQWFKLNGGQGYDAGVAVDLTASGFVVGGTGLETPDSSLGGFKTWGYNRQGDRSGPHSLTALRETSLRLA